MAFRFIQGALECVISPGYNIIIARWYMSREHSSRSLVFQSANAGWGIVADLTFYGLAKRKEQFPDSWAAWRGIEAFLGAQTLVVAVLSWFFLGTPNEVRWLDHRQKVMANARIMKNHNGTDKTGRDAWNWTQVKEAFLDPILYFQFVNTFIATVVSWTLLGKH
jgi:ACS family allantoate permease-like MFS transporter